jgi:hypothetical protein
MCADIQQKEISKITDACKRILHNYHDDVCACGMSPPPPTFILKYVIDIFFAGHVLAKQEDTTATF